MSYALATTENVVHWYVSDTTDTGKGFELINELDLKRVPMLADEVGSLHSSLGRADSSCIVNADRDAYGIFAMNVDNAKGHDEFLFKRYKLL